MDLPPRRQTCQRQCWHTPYLHCHLSAKPLMKVEETRQRRALTPEKGLHPIHVYINIDMYVYVYLFPITKYLYLYPYLHSIYLRIISIYLYYIIYVRVPHTRTCAHTRIQSLPSLPYCCYYYHYHYYLYYYY